MATTSKKTSAGKTSASKKSKASKAGASKTSARKKKPASRSSARKRIAPAREKRGLEPEASPLSLDGPEVRDLVALIERTGGAPIGAYREPLSGKALLLAAVPIGEVQPTPFQRDLSPTHVKRLAAKIDEAGSFLDPLIVVRGEDDRLWTPNGRHRLASAKVLGLKTITALISPDDELAYRILALNTEKAHNLKDRSLEVIRMAHSLAALKPRAKESSFSAEFEAAELLTLGLIYEDNSRFAGGAYRPLLKKIDRFSDRTLKASLRDRKDWAARIVDIDAMVKDIIAQLQKRGFKSPYLRTYVVARLNPVRWHRAKKGDDKPPMTLPAALTRMAASAKKFDPASVKQSELAMVAAVASDD